MTYIIEPSVFYWMNVIDGAKTVSVICAVFGMIAAVIVWGSYFADGGEFEEGWLKGPRIATLVAVVVGTLAAVFLPSKEALVAMLVAKTATVENVGWTVDALKEAVDYIVEAISKIRG